MASLRQLRYFVTVAEEGHMTRAARALELSQPSLSQAIAQLESQLGVELLVRHARGVSLTPAGATLFVKARNALAAAEDAEQTARSLARAATQTLDWGFIATPPVVDVPELYGAFTAAHPDVEVGFHDIATPFGTTASWLAQVDVAMVHSPTPHPDVNELVLREEPRVLLAASTHRLAGHDEVPVEEAVDEIFCGAHPGLEPVRAGFWRLEDHRGEPARVTADRASSGQEWIAIVATGRAVITAPESMSKRFLTGMPGIKTIALRGAYPTKLMLVWPKVTNNPYVEALVQLAREQPPASGAAAPAAGEEAPRTG